MSYNIKLTNGSSLTGPAGLKDGTVDSTLTSLTLIGKNYPGYGASLNENMVHLLENFANDIPPPNPLPGQVWWDTVNKLMKVNTSSRGTVNWKPIASTILSDTSPEDLAPGELWFDTARQQLFARVEDIVDGQTVRSWLLIGPLSSTATGRTGPEPSILYDSSDLPRPVIVFRVDSVIYGIFSSTSAFTPNSSSTVEGFSNIRPGFNLYYGGVSGLQYKYWGVAESASSLNLNGEIFDAGNIVLTHLPKEQKTGYLTSNVTGGYTIVDSTWEGNTKQLVTKFNEWTSGAVSPTFPGMMVYLNSNTSQTESAVSTATIMSTVPDGGIDFVVNVGGVRTAGARIEGTTGLMTVNGDPVLPTGVVTLRLLNNVANELNSNIISANNGIRSLIGNLASNLYANIRSLRDEMHTITGVADPSSATTLRRDGQNTITGNITPNSNIALDFGSPDLRFGTIWADRINLTSNITIKGVTNETNPDGDTLMKGNVVFYNSNTGLRWYLNNDYATIKFKSTGDFLDSYLEFDVGNEGDEGYKFKINETDSFEIRPFESNVVIGANAGSLILKANNTNAISVGESSVNFLNSQIFNFSSKVLSVNTAPTSGSYTLTSADNGCVLYVTRNGTDASIIRFPVGLPVGFNVMIIQGDNSTVYLLPALNSGVAVNQIYGKNSILRAYGIANALCVGAGKYVISGDLA